MINDMFATFAYSSIKGKWQKEKKNSNSKTKH